MDDQLTTIILSVLSSGIFIKLIDIILNRRKQRLETEKQKADIAKQKVDTVETIQDTYAQFVVDTKQRLDELCAEVKALEERGKQQDKIIADQQKQLDIQAKRLSEQDKIIAAQGVKIAEQDEQIAQLIAENTRLKKQK